MKVTTNSKMGRPKVSIDWARLDEACSVGCLLSECAGVLTAHQGIWISEDVIEFRIREAHNLTFSAYRDKKESPNKERLREKQWTAAIEGKSPVDRIWMGKQKLEQSDKVEQQHVLSPEIQAYRMLHAETAKRLQEAEAIEGEVLAVTPLSNTP